MMETIVNKQKSGCNIFNFYKDIMLYDIIAGARWFYMFRLLVCYRRNVFEESEDFGETSKARLLRFFIQISTNDVGLKLLCLCNFLDLQFKKTIDD